MPACIIPSDPGTTTIIATLNADEFDTSSVLRNTMIDTQDEYSISTNPMRGRQKCFIGLGLRYLSIALEMIAVNL